MGFKVGDRVRVLTDRPQSSYFMKGDEFVISSISSDQINGSKKGEYSKNFVYETDIELIGDSKMTRKIWEVLVVDKKKDEIVLREIVIDGDEKNACAKVSISFADKLKDLIFDNLCYITKELGSYERKEKE